MNRPVAAIAVGLLVPLFLAPLAQGQLRRPGIFTVKREDPNKSNLIREQGAIYLEGMVAQEVKVRITQAGPAYANLTGQRWLGNILANQEATLLAVSDRAYRIRARAQQGQIAGWVSKAIVSGLPDDFEDKLIQYHERYVLVRQLIENEQVALGMTVDEVIASIGPPDTRSSHLDAAGRTDTLEFISYERVPQTVVTYDRFGLPVPATRYIEVESGRVTIEFTDNLASAITETEGLNFNGGRPYVQVPAWCPLF